MNWVTDAGEALTDREGLLRPAGTSQSVLIDEGGEHEDLQAGP
jgi:hypothetical protein